MRFILAIFIFFPVLAMAQDSTCYGTTSNGRLENAAQLPSGGTNYEGYSSIARLAGRTYVHSAVRDIVVSAYQDLESEQPDKVYKYAEAGFREGGPFSPHKTHMNGLSVDFMVPVINSDGRSVHLPTHSLNKFGYNIEFDENSHYDGLQIDYEAMAAHIVALHQQSKLRGYDLWRVIFDPELQPNLFSTQYAEYLRSNIEFSTRRSWVRHDEHYHIDFDVPCEQL
ncbi:penicillin-insensitive murein endopeptidase [Nitrincola sp.]|uniref:penicillin-insensitive murein endopeptidase n=1 Tax=Nitrincola sp. TaxID=1926584 RepID=UPI003A8F8075